jgi:hypothetical protein
MNRIASPKLPPVLLTLASLAIALVYMPHDARAFCGFYVGKADGTLVNHASQVVIARHEDKTVISMMNDYQGPMADFAVVVPVPVILQKGQVHVGDPELFGKLEAYSTPRLVEYFDPNPCEIYPEREMMMSAIGGARAAMPAAPPMQNKALGVTVEAQYTVGEYDIVILSAKQSDGLEIWLKENGYKIPSGASAALAPYIRQDMKFFVAKVNLEEHRRSGLQYLRPLQFAFESPKFMLPIRLGMINSNGPQDLIVYLLTRDGRVETTNYRTVKMPTGENIPEFVRNDFKDFYKATFDEQVKRNDMRAVFTEYAWNMGWCDPCAAPPLTPDELRGLGVFWLDQQSGPTPMFVPRPSIGGGTPVMLTRLHLRYTSDSFPEDLVFQETGDSDNYQARYVMQHPWSGAENACPAARSYFTQLKARQMEEAQTLADLTGWNIDNVIKKAGLSGAPTPDQWWLKIWN